DAPPIRLLATVAAVASILALLTGTTAIVPGLLVACPLVLVGLVSFRRAGTDDGPPSSRRAASLAASTFAGFALAVIATQYATGGSGEWGGRYFAIGLPLLVPVCLLNLRRVGRKVSDGSRRVAAAALVVCTACLSVIGINGLRYNHDFRARLMAA